MKGESENMKIFKVIYTFEKDLAITEEVEAENKSEVIGKTKDLDGFVEVYCIENHFHRFNIDDVKLITIQE